MNNFKVKLLLLFVDKTYAKKTKMVINRCNIFILISIFQGVFYTYGKDTN